MSPVFLSGGFLSDAGWYGDAEKVFLSCLQLCMLHDEILHWYRALECCVRWDGGKENIITILTQQIFTVKAHSFSYFLPKLDFRIKLVAKTTLGWLFLTAAVTQW